LLIALLSNSAWIIGCRAGSLQNASMDMTGDMSGGTDVPDCCRHGICPYHREHPHAPSPSDSDCTCHISSDATMIVGMSRGPAVYTVVDSGSLGLLLADDTPRVSVAGAITLELPVPTPPPRS